MRKKLIALLAAMVLMVGATSPAFAVEDRQTITVDYGISLVFNHAIAQISARPFVYGGVTYVPIRAISELFGASVEYDGATNSAYIYDDFAEVCAVANRMEGLVNNCFRDLLMDMYSAEPSGETRDDSVYKENSGKIERMFSVLETIGNDNVNAEILFDEVLDSYGTFIIDYADCRNAYVQVKRNPSQYFVDQYFDLVHKAIDDYGEATYHIEKFFDDYCCWRDLGF